MMMDIQWMYLLPLISVFIGLAVHLWHHTSATFPPGSQRALYVPKLGLNEQAEPTVQPILQMIRTVRRKLLQVDDCDEEAHTFVLLQSC